MIGVLIKRLYRMADAETLGGFLRNFLRHDTHPFLQFVKYGIAGVIATLVTIITVKVLQYTVLPLEENLWNFTYAMTVAFFLSGTVAYFLNVWFVFEPGKHSRGKECFYFFAVAGFAFGIGTPLGQFLIHHFHWVGVKSNIALGLSIVTSVMVNYACRKFLIFKG